MATLIKNKYFTLLLALLFILPVNTGCSSSDDNNDNTDPPIEEVENKYVVYEVNPGLFGDAGESFTSIENRLDDIKALGANVIWLMPVYEQGVLNAFGSPYCVKDFKSINGNYGTLAELKSLVQKAHDKNMKVILDWVANHTSWDNVWIQNKSWYTQDATGNIVSPPQMGWADVADLNFDNQDMRAAMQDAMLYWVKEVNVDGYRCDYAEGVPDDFWKSTIEELKTVKGDQLIMLAESGEASYYNLGFDMTYGWDFSSILEKVYDGKTTLANLYSSNTQEYVGVPKGKQRLRFTTNHDKASEKSPVVVYKGENGALSAFVITATLAGSPMIYSSQEIGYNRALSFFGHNPLNWDSNAEYHNHYKKIMDIYTSSDALRKGTLRAYDTGMVASYYRESQNEGIFVMVNTTNSSQTIKVPMEQAYEEGTNLIDNTTIVFPTTFTLEPYQYFIWKMK